MMTVRPNLSGSRLYALSMALDDVRMHTDCHCSKCCPVKPPTPAGPDPVPWGAFLWGGGAIVAIVAGWALLMWMGHVLWP